MGRLGYRVGVLVVLLGIALLVAGTGEVDRLALLVIVFGFGGGLVSVLTPE